MAALQPFTLGESEILMVLGALRCILVYSEAYMQRSPESILRRVSSSLSSLLAELLEILETISIG